MDLLAYLEEQKCDAVPKLYGAANVTIRKKSTVVMVLDAGEEDLKAAMQDPNRDAVDRIRLLKGVAEAVRALQGLVRSVCK